MHHLCRRHVLGHIAAGKVETAQGLFARHLWSLEPRRQHLRLVRGLRRVECRKPAMNIPVRPMLRCDEVLRGGRLGERVFVCDKPPFAVG